MISSFTQECSSGILKVAREAALPGCEPTATYFSFSSGSNTYSHTVSDPEFAGLFPANIGYDIRIVMQALSKINAAITNYAGIPMVKASWKLPIITNRGKQINTRIDIDMMLVNPVSDEKQCRSASLVVAVERLLPCRQQNWSHLKIRNMYKSFY